MKKLIIGVVACLFVFGGSAFAGYTYKVKVDHTGGNITPSKAYEMVQKDPSHKIIDTRTRAEYQLIGHPEGAYNIPMKFWSGELGEKKYGMTKNSDFEKDLLARFNPKKDKLIFMCRSGKRSCYAVQAAIKAGWDPKNIHNMLGGFEGDKIKDRNSAYKGQRKLGGWRNEGLPWTYTIDKKLVYKTDLAE